MTTTGKLIRQELVNKGICLLIGQADDSENSTDYFADVPRLKSTRFSSSKYDNCMIRFATDTSGDLASDTSADYMVVQVDYLDQAEGRLYVTPVLNAATAADSQIYEIWRAGVNPQDVDRMRDKALTSLCNVWKSVPLTILTDGDMEKAGVTDWTVGGTATLTKATLSFPSEFARRVLNVANAAANDYAQSASIYTRPTTQFTYHIPSYTTVGTSEIRFRDVTNSAFIGDAITNTGTYWTWASGTFQAPATCYEIQVWLRGQESSADINWGPISLFPANATRFSLPDRVVSRSIGKVFQVRDMFGLETKHQIPVGYRRERVADNVQIIFAQPPGVAPLYYHELAYYDALTTSHLGASASDSNEEPTRENRQTGDLATTNCPLEYAAAGTAKLLAELQMVKYPEEAEYWSGVLTLANRDLTRWDLEFGAEPEIIYDNEYNLRLPFYRV